MGTCQISIENIFLQFELVDDQGNHFSFQPNIGNEKENVDSEDIINTNHSSVDEEINVKVEDINKGEKNVVESQRSDANCLRPYEEIKIKFEEGFFDEHTINYDYVENIIPQSLHESLSYGFSAQVTIT